MKIACDVMGTLEGRKKKQILKMLDIFSRAGADITVWSNLYSYAVDAVKNNNLKAEYDSKKMMLDYDDPSEAMDLAIEDDRSQTWLGARRFLFVDEIPEDMAEVELLANKLLGEIGESKV